MKVEARDVTIRDVAKHAGVSVKTVSRVINGEPFVRDATRAHVIHAVDELGFVVDLAARRLATGQAYAIGLVFHNASWHYTLDVQRAVLHVARQAGYSTIMHPCDTGTELDSRDILRMVAQRVVDGFVFVPPTDNAAALLARLQQLNVPFVRLTPSERDSALPYVSATDARGACDMTLHLLDLGHRRIGFVRGPAEQRAAHERFAGYRHALAAHGVEFDPALVKYGNDYFASGCASARELLQGKPPPSAIFCNNDEMAAGAIAATFEMGLRVPEDVSVAGFDDTALARQIWPPLTTVRQPIYDMAEIATNLLLALLNGAEIEETAVEIPTELIVRKSTGAVPGQC